MKSISNQYVELHKDFVEKYKNLNTESLKRASIRINRFISISQFYRQEDFSRLYDFYNNNISNNRISKLFQGGAGFFIISHLIEHNKTYSEVDQILLNENVKLYMLLLYEIELKWNLVYYQSGTTSYIFKGTFDNEDRIFKIIKPKYSNNEVIINQTKNYLTFQPNFDFTPDVYKSNSFCIHMEYISGKTLKELNNKLLELSLKSSFNNNQKKEFEYFRFVLLSRIIKKIVILLEELYQSKKINCHGDINPGNIIITNCPLISFDNLLQFNLNQISDNLKVKFIDFGKNYLLNDDFGSTRDVASVLVYASKEIIEGKEYSYKADIYSLGIIILELWSYQEKFEEKKIDSYRHALREKNPIIASLLNEMLNDNYTHRLDEDFYRYDKNLSLVQNPNPYTYLKNIINTEFEIAISQLEPKSKKWIPKVLSIVIQVITNDFADIFNQIIGNKRIITNEFIKDIDNIYRTKLDYNYYRAIISNASNVVVVSYFFYFVLNFYTKDELFWDFFPGLFICMIFAPLAHTFYMNIFSQISTKDLGFLGVIVEFWLWLCTFYYAPIIIYFSYNFPNKWPLATFIGTMIIAINNTLHYFLAKKSLLKFKHRIKNYTLISSGTNTPSDFENDLIDNDLKDFKVWQLMYPFSLPMLFLYIFSSTSNAPHKLKMGLNFILYDEIAYAFIIFIIIVKLYFDNNQYQGPKLSSFIQYCYCEHRKIIYLDKIKSLLS